MRSRTLVVVAGATATGKTDTAIRLAEHFHAPILSCDSRQFYREIPIGTAAPTPEQLARVPHYFVGNKSITEEYNSGRFEQDALRLLGELFRSHPVVVMAGGSGLYIDAVCSGFDPVPPADPDLRRKLNDRFEREGLSTLTALLERLDPEYYRTVDRNNPKRVIRALEVCLSTGGKFSDLRRGGGRERPFGILKIALDIDRPLLYQRIDQRVDRMIGAGLPQEAERMLPYRNHNALQTVGYREIFDFLDGKTSFDQAVEEIKKNSRRYAKRQFTWFRRDAGMNWMPFDRPQEIIGFIEERIGYNRMDNTAE